jgi:nucleoside-diphosphate-sugar epimerase
LAQKHGGGTGAPPAAMLAYGVTKRAGTQACLAYENATVLRVYNLHGLPHQSSSGLHQLCGSVRTALNGGTPPSLINTTRDYVHWQTVRLALDAALDFNSRGMIEVCSGYGIAMSEIIEGLPLGVRTQIFDQLKPANYFAPVVGSRPSLGVEVSSKPSVIEALRDEVMTCASS